MPTIPSGSRKRRLRYANINMPGASEPWSNSADNPMSAAFVPLTERDENAKARWWAKQATGHRGSIAGTFDEE